jgi:SAM-dependent methyltransferase
MSVHEADTAQRLEREQAFHDEAYAGGADAYRPETSKYYSIGTGRKAYYESLFEDRLEGATTLEYGCGLGDRAIFLARRGAQVTAIDLSPVAIELARQRAEREGVGREIDFRVMDAERLAFADDTFDLITGAGVLHHLDLSRGLPELARVLKPGGTAVFSEPLGHNPFINLYRRRSGELRTPDEHPLLVSDIALLREHFGQVRARFFSLTSVPAYVLRRVPGFGRLLRALDGLDQVLFRLVPVLRRYAWFVVLQVSRPR